ncbi:CaiB/BaiF CoA transferase family protein [Chloroflexota bacterium]
MYQLLTGCRALDLTDERGYLCGRMLADIGVDVIKVEKSGGDLGRRLGPFYHDIPHPEKSLFYFAYNMNKRGITLDIEKADGKEILKKLVKTADFVLESFAPGYLDSLGLGYEHLSKINKGIILTSISPFGCTGPYKDYKAYDLVASAMGSAMYLTGDSDQPPVRVSFPQAYLLGASQAAAGAMIAHYYRELTGEGQWVDTSVQGSWLTTVTNTMGRWEFSHTITHRQGSMRIGLFAQASARILYRCKDGFFSFLLVGGRAGARTNRALVEWMDSEGMADEYIKSIDWLAFDVATITQEEVDKIENALARFFLTHTKAELQQGAMDRHIIGLPLSGFADLLQNPQLHARNYWHEVDHPELGGKITYPGTFVKLPEMPLNMDHSAPLIGEHNEDVYAKELGLSKGELIILKQAGVI